MNMNISYKSKLNMTQPKKFLSLQFSINRMLDIKIIFVFCRKEVFKTFVHFQCDKWQKFGSKMLKSKLPSRLSFRRKSEGELINKLSVVKIKGKDKNWDSYRNVTLAQILRDQTVNLEDSACAAPAELFLTPFELD